MTEALMDRVSIREDRQQRSGVRATLRVYRAYLRAFSQLDRRVLLPQLQLDLRKSYGNLLFEALPSNVTSLDCGKGVVVERPQDQIASIPEDNRLSWDLPTLDAQAGAIASRFGLPYRRVFPT